MVSALRQFRKILFPEFAGTTPVLGSALFLVAAEFNATDLAGDGLGQLCEFQAADALEGGETALQMLEDRKRRGAGAISAAPASWRPTG